MLNGITVEKPKEGPCLTAGHRLYIIGGQNGLFPQHGEHIPYEMWGIWAPPVKIWNGFWIKINGSCLEAPDAFEMLPYGAKFLYRFDRQLDVERFQYVPQDIPGFVLRIILKNQSVEKKPFEITLGAQSNLMPVWPSDRAGITDGSDSFLFEEADNRIMFRDSENPWRAGIASSEQLYGVVQEEGPPEKQQTNEKTCYCEGRVTVSLNSYEEKTVYFYFAASDQGIEDLKTNLNRIEKEQKALLEEKLSTYRKLSCRASLAYEKEPVLEQMYLWTKYINDWIIRKVPGTGRGVVAGYPEFPWWFGNDTNYIVPALLLQGEEEICKDTLRLIKKKSEEVNGNGRVVHEISTNGIVYYEGMSTETPQFADTVWEIYRFTGDMDFLREMFDFCLQGMQWVESISEGGLPEGYGISEIAGLDCKCSDTAILAIRGYEVIGLMAEELGKESTAQYYRKKFHNLWELFQNEFFIPELGVYGDMVASKEEIMPRAEAWKYTLKSFPISEDEEILGESSCKKDKSPEGAEDKERLRIHMQNILEIAKGMPDGSRKAFYLFGLNHSAIPAEFGYLKGKEAKKVLDAMADQEEKHKLRIESMMPIGVGRKIRAFGNAGQATEILKEMKKVAKGFSGVMPGATNEIYPNAGCFVQAWNSLATMWPYANSILGIQPLAGNKKIMLSPCVCEEMDGICLRNIIIGQEEFSFALDIKGKQKKIIVECPDTGWTIQSTNKEIELIIIIK